jgi:SPW repeat
MQLTVKPPKWRDAAILDIYNLLLGGFLAVSPWLFAYSRGIVRADAWIGGAIIVALSMAAIVAFAEWEEWFNLAIGLWLIASPWVLGFQHTVAMHVSIAVGVLVAYLAAVEIGVVHARYSPWSSADTG